MLQPLWDTYSLLQLSFELFKPGGEGVDLLCELDDETPIILSLYPQLSQHTLQLLVLSAQVTVTALLQLQLSLDVAELQTTDYGIRHCRRNTHIETLSFL